MLIVVLCQKHQHEPTSRPNDLWHFEVFIFSSWFGPSVQSLCWKIKKQTKPETEPEKSCFHTPSLADALCGGCWPASVKLPAARSKSTVENCSLVGSSGRKEAGWGRQQSTRDVWMGGERGRWSSELSFEFRASSSASALPPRASERLTFCVGITVGKYGRLQTFCCYGLKSFTGVVVYGCGMWGGRRLSGQNFFFLSFAASYCVGRSVRLKRVAPR